MTSSDSLTTAIARMKPLALLVAIAALCAGFMFGRLLIGLRSDIQPAGPSTEDLYKGWY